MINGSPGPVYCTKIFQEIILAICLEYFLNLWAAVRCLSSPCLHSHTWTLQFNKRGAAGTHLETIVQRSKLRSLPRAFGLGCQCKLKGHWASREIPIKFLHTKGQRWHHSPLSCQFHKSMGKPINSWLLKCIFFSLLKGGSVNDYARATSLIFKRETSLHFQLGTCLKL